MRVLEYGFGQEAVTKKVGAALKENHIVLIKNFPASKDRLTTFCANFGSFLPPYGTRIENIDDMVGDVWVNPNISTEERLLTEGNSELGPHTAHAWRVERPRFFGLLMIDPGWRDQEQGNNGESIFTHINDILAEIKIRFPESYSYDFRLLHTTSVELPVHHMEDEVANSPILFDIDNDKGIGVRYKGNTKELIAASIPLIPNGRAYYEALSRFYEVAEQTSQRIEIGLDAGDFVLLDNRRVMHARRTFPFSRTGPTGMEINPRYLYNIHIL